MRKFKQFAMLLMMLLMMMFMGLTSAYAYSSFSLGFSVGNYDYYPYRHPSTSLSVNFYDVMNDYGYWVSVRSFGRCWRPYATSGWRPYLYGHWVTTQYGQTWQGYEPWAWVGYHYGNWISTPEFGWVWVPGYDWHPGRVIWGEAYGSIGWMPAPPPGTSYSCGYLSYGNCGYSSPYYNPAYTNISFNLWVFIDRNRYFNDNYADFYFGRDYTRRLFTTRVVRINAQPLRRTELERIVGRRVQEVPIEVKQIRMKDRSLRVVVPKGEEEHLRIHAQSVVSRTIAPAVSEKRKVATHENTQEKFQAFSKEKERVEVLEPDRGKSSSEKIVSSHGTGSEKVEKTPERRIPEPSREVSHSSRSEKVTTPERSIPEARVAELKPPSENHKEQSHLVDHDQPKQESGSKKTEHGKKTSQKEKKQHGHGKPNA